MNIVITGSGAPGSIGTRFCIENSKTFKVSNLIGIDSNLAKEKISKSIFSSFELVPATDSTEYLPKLFDLCEKHNVNLIIPQTTREIEKLSAANDLFAEKELTVAVSGFESIQLANDKFEVTKRMKSLGYSVPSIQTVSNKDDLLLAIKNLGYPSNKVVIKAKNLNGKRGFRIISDKQFSYKSFIDEKPQNDEISLEVVESFFPDMFDELMVMEFLPGKEYSVDAFLGKECAIAIPRVREIIRSGISFSNRLENNKMLCQATIDIGRNLGLYGVYGVQYRENVDGELCILEINPRIQGTMVVAALSGANIISMFIDELINKKYNHEYSINWDTCFERYWGGFGINDKGYTRI